MAYLASAEAALAMHVHLHVRVRPRRRFVLQVALAAVLAAVATHARPSDVLGGSASFRLPDGAAIGIETSAGHVRGRLVRPTHVPAPGRDEVVTFDRPLASALRRAEQLVAVAGRGFADGGRTFVVLGVAIPSVDARGSGYCGAGSEDHLLLLEWKARLRKLELRDRVQVQSCLQPMALQADQGSELRTVLRGIDDPKRATLTWLEHPRYGPTTKTVTATAGKFVVSP